MSAIHRSTKVGLYMARPVQVEAMRWGPEWSQMKAGARWMGSRGILFRFDDTKKLADNLDEGLPRLWVSSPRYDKFEVRVGHYIVYYGDREIEIVSPTEFWHRFAGPHQEFQP